VNDYATIRRISIPVTAIASTVETLRAAGQRGAEAFVLWVGTRDGTSFTVKAAYVPSQTGYLTETGVCVIVRADELHRLNVWLYEQQLELIAQIHSHPTDAYHSETDDAYPIATRIGSFSLVIPDFAAAPFRLEDVAAYRLTAAGRWTELSLAEKRTIFHLENGASLATPAIPA
jgi:hypothetical protein